MAIITGNCLKDGPVEKNCTISFYSETENIIKPSGWLVYGV
jgi:hypothetical protein